MTAENTIKGKVFLITGAASGLGAGFASGFLKEGAKHVAILDVALATGEQTSRKLNETFGAGSASFHHCDVTDEKVLTAACQQIIAKHKRVDVVINNAGILDDSPANYRRANDVNWQALVTMTVLAREHMRADRGGAGGTIVNISSVAALLRFPSLPIYSGAKAAVLHFSSCLGMEPSYSRSKVRVLSISFGPTYTPLMEHVDRKCMDQQLGKEYADMHNPDNYQSVESAVASMLTAVQRGQSGSAWLSIKNQPAKDISQHLHAAYAEIAKAFV